MKDILILGGNSTLGGELAKVFPQSQTWQRADFDALNFEELKTKIANLSKVPEAVINCVAYNDVDEAEENEELANKINGEFVGRLAELCRWFEIPLVHFSTNYVFDGEKGEYTESDEPKPICAYGKSKFLGEKLLLKNTDKFYLIRTSVLLGPKGQSQNSKESFVEKMLKLAKTEGRVFAVSDEIYSVTLASDLAAAVKYILRQNMPFGIYHAVNLGQASWYDIAKDMFFFLQKPVEVLPISGSQLARKAKRPKRAVLLNTKLYQLQPWPDALRELLVKEYQAKKRFDVIIGAI